MIAVVATWSCREAAAQIPPPPPQPVDPAVADVSPLSTSFRDMQVDFRQPLAFKQVYRVPGQPNEFMRANGALYATFPLSAYRNTKDGVQVLIPAGTVFHIGAPWLMFGPPPPKSEENDPPSLERMMTRLDLTLPSTMQIAQITGAFREDEQDVNDWSTTPPMRHPWSLRMAAMNEKAREDAKAEARFGSPDGPVAPTIANDAFYRLQRLTALLQQAAKAEKGHADIAPASGEAPNSTADGD